ncbi:MAG: PfkB family carbohydrate kinase [Caulobacteraceae bacterium]
MSAPILLSLGSVNADFQMRIPEEFGEIETQLADDVARLSGGKATNRAFLARRFGHPARLFGRVGDDDLARQALDGLEKEGVDLTGVSVARGMSTAVSIILVPPSTKKRIFLASGASAHWDEQAVRSLEAAIAEAPPGSMLAVDYEISPDVVARALAAAVRQHIGVVIDPSPPRRVPSGAIGSCAAIAPNAEEAEGLTGIKVGGELDASRAAEALLGKGAAFVCLKLADGGAFIADKARQLFIAAPEVEAVDTTGAGDAFTGALAIGLMEGRSSLDAACLAIAAATMAVTEFGSHHGNLAPKHIEPLVAKIRRSVDV